MKVVVSRHAGKRAKQRMGIPKRAVQRLAESAWKKGTPHNKMKGHLRKWVNKQILNTPRKAKWNIIYNNHLFFFLPHEEDSVILLSMITIPANIAKHINNYLAD